jgi:hypothetical protein
MQHRVLHDTEPADNLAVRTGLCLPALVTPENILRPFNSQTLGDKLRML